MHSDLTIHLAHAEQAASTDADALTIRAATAGDAPALLRLAQLDSRHILRGEALLAERGRAPVAAIAVADGAVTADPFQRSGDAVRLLALRRRQLLGGR